MGAETPPVDATVEGPGSPGPSGPSAGEYEEAFAVAVQKAHVLVAGAAKDAEGRIKDDAVKWQLSDLMLELWPYDEGLSRQQKSWAQRQLGDFAKQVGYNLSMMKDFYYVAAAYPPEGRSPHASFARHSKLRRTEDRPWKLIGINREDVGEEPDAVKALNQAQRQKFNNLMKAIEAVKGENADVLDYMASRIAPKERRVIKKVIAAIREREKQARLEAEAARKAKSQVSIVYDYQASLLHAAATTQSLIELVELMKTPAERHFIRQVVEGTVLLNQKSLDDVLDALDGPVVEEDESIETGTAAPRLRLGSSEVTGRVIRNASARSGGSAL